MYTFQCLAFFHFQDSNQFHATCLDTYPPIFYLNGVSHRVIQLVTKYNELQGQIKVNQLKIFSANMY